MKRVFKRVLSLVLCFVMSIGVIATGMCSTKANAATFDEINNPDIFYQGNVSGPCNLAALTMLLRRVYIAQGKDWTTVTQSSVKSACCPDGSDGLWYSSNYNGISISHKSFSGGDSTLISLLAKHPEGIVLYNGGTGGVYHGVLVTDYTNGTFYCADYNYGSPSGRIPLSSIYGKYVTTNNATEYWYVSSPSVSLDEKYILKVYFNANGGSISSDDYSLSSNVIYNKSDSTKYYQKWTYNNAKDNGLVNATTFGIYKTGYTFAGWGTKASGGTVFDDRDTSIVPTDITSEIKNGDCSVTLYAQWEPNILKVHYNANGGSISSDEYSLSSDVIYNKSDSTKYYQKWTYNIARDNGLINRSTFGIYKEGYSFSGWSTKSSGGTILDPDDTTLVPTDLNSNIKNGDCSVTLYAVWTKNKYNFNFNSNGGSGTMSKMIVSFEESITFPKNTFTKTGYTFNGWNVKRNSDNKWHVPSVGWLTEDEIKENGYTKNLYADERSLTFDYSWLRGYDGISDYTLYANWRQNNLKVYYNANGGSITSDTYTLISDVIHKKEGSAEYYQKWTYNSAKDNGLLNRSSLGIYKDGYNFAGWGTKSTGGTIFDPDDTTLVPTDLTSNINNGDCSITLYAQWEKKTYKVSYDANGGSGAPSSQTKTYGTELTLSSTKPTRTGYTFTGWNTKADGTGTNYASGSKYTSNSAVTLYAQWKKVTYTVSYNANGGSGAPSSQTKTYGAELTLSSTKPTRTGYTFTGWNTKADGTGTNYASGSKYTSNSAVTLYAQWKKVTYTVSYNANGGSGAPSSQTKTYGAELTLSSTKPTRTGYTFTGWNTKADGTGTNYASGSKYTANSAVTLYAVWKLNIHNVTFVVNGEQYNSFDCAYSEIITVPDNPEIEGYNFVRWTPAIPDTMPDADITFTAEFELANYTATFVADGIVVSTQTFTIETEQLVEPPVPQKAGYYARWEHYEINDNNIIVNAKYYLPDVVMVSKQTLYVGDSYNLLTSSNFEVINKVWKSSDSTVATVNQNGKITAVGEGDCRITVVCYGKDSLGNDIQATESTKIIVKEPSNKTDIKQSFREMFDEFFEVTIHDLVFNLKKFLIILFRYAY